MIAMTTRIVTALTIENLLVKKKEKNHLVSVAQNTENALKVNFP